jgi:hypothetical protein
MEIFLSDNVGNRVPPGVASGHPVLASAQKLTYATAGTDVTVAVTAGKTYLAAVQATITSDFLFGLAATSTPANVGWVCSSGQKICIKIPVGYTTLHYATTVNNGVAYLIELAE